MFPRVGDRAAARQHPARRLPLVVAAVAACVAAPLSAAAQWPFNPSGYFYPKEQAPGGLDHVTVLWEYEKGRDPEQPGLYTHDGRLHRFSSLVTEPAPDHSRILFEFDTKEAAGPAYSFRGVFHDDHVYEEHVNDSTQVVASGTLRIYRRGKLQQEARVQLTYSPKPRNLLGNVNVPLPSGKTDLMVVVFEGNDLGRVRTLLAGGANVNAAGPARSTALQTALYGRRPSAELIGILLGAGADVNAAEDDGTTPLIYAMGHADDAVVKLLLAAGADVNAADEHGLTALICEVQGIRRRNGSRESVKALLRAGADVNAKDKSGRTALSIARANHDDETVAILLQAGAKE